MLRRKSNLQAIKIIKDNVRERIRVRGEKEQLKLKDGAGIRAKRHSAAMGENYDELAAAR